MTTYRLTIPWKQVKGVEKPLPPLSMNDRSHWRAGAPVKARVREAVAEQAREAGIPAATAIWVRIHYIHPPTDAGTPTTSSPPKSLPWTDS